MTYFICAVCCSVLQCVAVCCSVLPYVAVSCHVLQWVAVCCRVLQCAAACCSALQCVAMCCSVLPCVAVCCSALQRVVVCYSVLQRVAMCCSVLQCVAVCCSVFQGAAVRCSTITSAYTYDLAYVLSYATHVLKLPHNLQVTRLQDKISVYMGRYSYVYMGQYSQQRPIHLSYGNIVPYTQRFLQHTATKTHTPFICEYRPIYTEILATHCNKDPYTFHV